MENQDEVPVPAQARRRRPTPDHPPYSEMVQRAIRSLAERHGSTESSISAYIESHYHSLSWAHSRLLPYYLRKLLLSREISKSPIPNRYVLPEPSGPNPSSPRRSPKSPRKRGRPRKEPPASPPQPAPFGPKRCRGRPPKFVVPEPEPEPQRPRLILRLKRSKVIQIHPDGGVVSGRVWQCLKECVGEKESKGVGSYANDEELSPVLMRENDSSGVKSDGEVSALRDENAKGVEIDEHYEELLALQENGLGGGRSHEHSEELSMLREEDLNGVMIDEHDEESSALEEGDADGIEIAEHSGERSLFKEGDASGIEIAEHNGELLASQENGLDSIRTDEHNGELSILREGDLDAIRIVERNGDLSELQESNVNSVRIMEHNGELSELQENDLKNSIRSDEHNEELQIAPDAPSCKKPESDMGTLRKKAKPRKTRRLWYES